MYKYNKLPRNKKGNIDIPKGHIINQDCSFELQFGMPAIDSVFNKPKGYHLFKLPGRIALPKINRFKNMS